MQIGIVTVGSTQVGVVTLDYGAVTDSVVSDTEGYEPQGRASEGTLGGSSSRQQSAVHHGTHGGSAPIHHEPVHHGAPGRGAEQGHQGEAKAYTPKGESYQAPGHSTPFRQGSAETDRAIVDASIAHHQDPNTMRAIASIESGMNPSSNANRSTQYKGLYQVGHNEWDRFGNGGNIYSAQDNAMATGRMFDANSAQFRKHYGRDPSDTELYMMHQQGLGFYTRGAMTNISGNPYPGMHGPQTHESFEAGWGRELARRKAGFVAANPKPVAAAPVFDPETMAP